MTCRPISSVEMASACGCLRHIVMSLQATAETEIGTLGLAPSRMAAQALPWSPKPSQGTNAVLATRDGKNVKSLFQTTFWKLSPRRQGLEDGRGTVSSHDGGTTEECPRVLRRASLPVCASFKGNIALRGSAILLLRAARRSVEAFNRTRRSNGQLRSRSGQAPTRRPAGKELQLKKQSSACCLFEPLRSGRGRGRQCRGDFGPSSYDVVALEFGGLYARSPYRSTFGH